ncbi:hypothetical protein R3P38DRAFT_2419052, partial [Favolaschia claudopus]
LESLKIAMQFARGVRDAKLSDENIGAAALDRLQAPLEDPGNIADDPDLLHSLRLFLATSNASEQTYTDAINAAMEHHP